MKKLLIFALSAAALISCTDDDIRTEHQLDSGPKVVGFNTNIQTVSYFEDLGTIDREFPINLIGTGNGQFSESDIVVEYEVDMVQSTAVEGVEFDFLDTSGTMTIPAGSSFGMFPLAVHTGNFDPLQKTELIVKLTSSTAGSTVAGQVKYNTLRIVFVGCLSNIVTGALGSTDSFACTIVRDDGGTWYRGNEIVELVDINTYKSTTTGGWAAGTIAPDQGYNFMDICGDISVPQQGLCQGYYSNEVYGLTDDGTDGTVVDFSTGNDYEITYEITFAAGNRQYTNTYVRN